ncbi:putative actin-depolymerizing factor 12-like, partial [Capsicum annuum]
MTMSLEEASKKTSRPQLVVLNKAFKLAEQWVNSMGGSSDDVKPKEAVLESRPPRLGIGAAVPRQSQTVLSNDPAERR